MNLRPHSLAAILIAFSWAKSAAAEIIVVDDFTTASSGTSFVQGSGILGGERDVVVNNGLTTTFSASSGAAQIALSSGTSNFVLLDYDGLDGNAGLASFLLGDLDLTDGGQQ